MENDVLNLESIDSLLLEPGTKGLPAGVGPITIAEARKAGWRLHRDLQMPAAILRRPALANNADWMRRFVGQMPGLVLCPHGKTTMAPQLMDRQLREGAWGMTCATIAHLRCYRRFGVQRVLFANQIVEQADAAWLAGELRDDPGFEIHIFVDSVDGVARLSDAAMQAGLERPISLLLEVGVAGGRTGVQSVTDGLAIAQYVDQAAGVELSGVATFEGVVQGKGDLGMEPHVEDLFARVGEIALSVAQQGFLRAAGPVILSAGGSRFFDLAAARLKAVDLGRETLVILRSGCYISHDAHHYEAAFRRMTERQVLTPIAGALENALEIWASVQSRPEPERAYANLGKRDVSYDIDLPYVLAARRGDNSLVGAEAHVLKLSDQHAHLSLPESSPLRFGDRLGFGISHPCTTFDKWRFLFEVDEDDMVVDIIATMF